MKTLQNARYKIVTCQDINGHVIKHQVKINTKYYVHTILYRYNNAGKIKTVNMSFNETLLLDCDNNSYTTITNECKPYKVDRPLKRSSDFLYSTWTTSDNKTRSIQYYYPCENYVNIQDFIDQRY